MIVFQDEITYDIPGNAKASQYFFVTPDSGVVHLKKDLMEDTGRDAQYRVSQTVFCSWKYTMTESVTSRE